MIAQGGSDHTVESTNKYWCKIYNNGSTMKSYSYSGSRLPEEICHIATSREESSYITFFLKYENNVLYLYSVESWDDSSWAGIEFTLDGILFNVNAKTHVKKYKVKDEIQLEYTSYQLRPTIAKWYNALRTVALVGLLSVLVYIGIRIILSSGSAQNQAKYKTMLKDWLVALCLLFVLHYIMSFMLTISEKLIDIMDGTVTQEETELGNSDKLMNKLRTTMADKFYGESATEDDGDKGPGKFGESSGYSIMWFAMMLITYVFTFQYMKRLIYMAFLTMIAPLIALTYPLDKIKDGKAQAFSFWLREYIFNCLLQPVHLIIYTVFISSAFDFAQKNILYALLTLAFMLPAEKIIKEMFGLKGSGPSSSINAAASGALAMGLFNKLKSKPHRSNGEGGGQSKGYRPANNGNTSSGASRQSSPALASTGGGGVPPAGGGASPAGGGASPTGGGTPSAGGVSPAGGGTSPNTGSATTRSTRARNFRNGMREIVGPNPIRSGLGKFARATGKAAAGAAIGTIGAGIAAGASMANDKFDISDAAKNITATAGVGYAFGSGTADRAMKGAKDIGEKYKKGAMGVEAYNDIKFREQLFKSDDYKMLEQDSDIQAMFGGDADAIKEATEGYLDQGINDTGKIREAIKNNVSAEDYSQFEKMGVSSVEQMKKIQGAGFDTAQYKEFSDAGIKSIDEMRKVDEAGLSATEFKDIYSEFKDYGISDVDKVATNYKKLKDKGLSHSEIANLSAKAKKLKEAGRTEEGTAIKYFTSIGYSEDDAKEIYNKIKVLLT